VAFWKSWCKPYHTSRLLGQDSTQNLPEITQKIPFEPTYWTIITAIPLLFLLPTILPFPRF
jgi:hypothetical protein